MHATTEKSPVTRRVWRELEDTLATENPVKPLRILFATDGSEHAQAAREFLKALPLAPGSAIEFTTVITRDSWERPEWLREALKEWALRIEETATHELPWPGVGLYTTTREGREAEEILEAADEFDADLIVVGSRGLTGLDAFLIGSVARNVVKHAVTPVLIGRAPIQGLSEVVLAVDESPHAAEATEFLARFPLPKDSRITVVHVIRTTHPAVGLMAIDTAEIYEALQEAEEEEKERGRLLAEGARARLEAAGKNAVVEVRVGDPAGQILAITTERNADLIVAGARGTSLIENLITGSVADRLIKTAPCSVLITR